MQSRNYVETIYRFIGAMSPEQRKQFLAHADRMFARCEARYEDILEMRLPTLEKAMCWAAYIIY